METKFYHRVRFRDGIQVKAIYAVLIAIIAGVGLVTALSMPTDAGAAPQQSSPPRIVENGVNMVDAWNMPTSDWQAWLARPPGDDTYGSNDLLAVSVEFTEKVKVDSNTVFWYQTGLPGLWDDRKLVYVGQKDNVVYFATTVGNWNAPDGIRIGDQSETFGDDQEGYIKSAATGVNADLTHPALGVLPQHKVNGDFSRPDVVKFELLAPSCDEKYLRDELVTVKVTFDQNVRVQGTPQAVLKIWGTDGMQRRRASYSGGEGSSAIYLQYKVVEADRNRGGIRVDQNSMLIRRSDGNRPLNRASVVGERGGLTADLRTKGIARSSSRAVDGSRELRLYCETPLPEVPALVSWAWNGKQDASTSYSATFTILTDPGLGSGLSNSNFTAGSLRLNGYRFLIGLNSNQRNPRTPNNDPAKVAFCGSWDQETARSARATRTGWKVHPQNIAGHPIGLLLPYDWTTGTYTMTVKYMGDEDGAAQFNCYITAHGTDPETQEATRERSLIGTFEFRGEDDEAPRINPNSPITGSSISYGGTNPARPIDLPVMSVVMERPKFADMRRPRHGVVFYSPVHGIADNGLVVFDSSNQTVTLTAGGSTSHKGINGTGFQHTFNARR